ncbi:MAG: DUF2809 domain-containing protein [Gemmatimonadaceae bacterium]
MSPSLLIRTRLAFIALALGTIAAGLAVHWRRQLLPPALQDILGDALWAMMIAWWFGALLPNTRPAPRALLALVVCWCVELSQLYHTPALDALRRTTLGHLVLGSDFDVRDLAAYVVGIAVAFSLEAIQRRPSRAKRTC